MSYKMIGYLLAVLGSIMFSTKAVLVKLAYKYDVDATSLLMLRMLFSLPFFIGLYLYFKRKSPESTVTLRSYKWHVIVLGLMGYYIASYLDLSGLQYIDASLERIILFLYPTLVVIISFIALKKPATTAQVIAIIITYIGIVLAYAGNYQVSDNPNQLHGSILIIGSAFFYAIYLVGSQQIITKVNSKMYNASAMITACLAILIHNALINGFNLFTFSVEVYIYALMIAMIATVIPSFLIVEAIKIIGANNSSIIGTIGPVSTITLAVLLLGERLSLTQIFGSLIVISGVLFLILNKNKIVERK